MLEGFVVGFHDEVVATEGGCLHEQGGQRMVEIGDHRIGQSELIGREDELIGPSLILLQHAVGTYSGLGGLDDAGAHSTDMVLLELGLVDDAAGLGADEHLLGVHLVLGQVFHLDVVEVAEGTVEGDEGEVDAADLHALHKLAAEVQTGSGSGDGTLVLGIDALELLLVVGGCGTAVDHIMGQRCLAQGIELALELIVGTVVEEAQRAAAAGGVVDDLGHHGPTVIEEQLVAYSDLAGRLYEDIPQTHLLVQLAQEEHLDLGVGLLLGTIQTGREHLGVVEDKGVALAEVVEHIAEVKILALDGVAIGVFLEHLDGLRLTVEHHQTALVATGHAEGLVFAGLILECALNVMRIQSNLFFW